MPETLFLRKLKTSGLFFTEQLRAAIKVRRIKGTLMQI